MAFQAFADQTRPVQAMVISCQEYGRCIASVTKLCLNSPRSFRRFGGWVTEKPEIVDASGQTAPANDPAITGALARVWSEKRKPGGMRHV